MLALEGMEVRLGEFRLALDAEIAGGAGGGAGRVGEREEHASVAAGRVPDAGGGRITWEGRDITRLAPAERPMSILFQDGNLFPHLTVAQNVGWPCGATCG
jgi:thiamine transport system ATP-binding protein